MKSILNAFYMGNLDLSQGSFPNDTNYRSTTHNISDIKTMFGDKLSADDAATLEKLYNLQSEIVSYDTSESFKSGFCTSALVMMEVLTSEEADACE